MAIAVAAATGKTSSALGAALTLSGLSTTAGRLYAVTVISVFTNSNTMAVTDNVGTNGWTVAAEIQNSVFFYAGIWLTSVASPAAITSVTCTASGTNSNLAQHCFRFFEITGANNTTPVDVTKTNSASTGTAATTGATSTPAGADDLALGVICDVNANANMTALAFTGPGGTRTDAFDAATGGNAQTCVSSREVLSSAAAQTYSGTRDTFFDLGYAAVVALIKASASQLFIPRPRGMSQAVQRSAFR